MLLSLGKLACEIIIGATVYQDLERKNVEGPFNHTRELDLGSGGFVCGGIAHQQIKTHCLPAVDTQVQAVSALIFHLLEIHSADLRELLQAGSWQSRGADSAVLRGGRRW